jgi:hypothetical protein
MAAQSGMAGCRCSAGCGSVPRRIAGRLAVRERKVIAGPTAVFRGRGIRLGVASDPHRPSLRSIGNATSRRVRQTRRSPPLPRIDRLDGRLGSAHWTDPSSTSPFDRGFEFVTWLHLQVETGTKPCLG